MPYVLLAFAGCGSGVRDVVPEGRDVHVVSEADAAAPTSDAYTYVARRPRAAVGLVGARHMAHDDATRVVDRIADELDACAARAEHRGELTTGAAQLVAMAGPRGNAEITDMRLAPGGPVAANALECLVSPLRAMTLEGPSGASPPVIAIEATWEPRSDARERDAGAP